MSELKEVYAYQSDEIESLAGNANGNSYYPKPEVDKVIADLEESHKMEIGQLLIEISELKETLKNSRNAHKYWRKEYLIEYKECLHNKHKRCLAMAEMCNARYDEEDAKVNGCGASWEYISNKMKYWERWHNRWLAIAEKFKTNSTINRKEATNAL